MAVHSDDGLTPAQKLLTMTLGIVQTQLLNIAAQLNLADRLKDGPKSAMELAEVTGMDPPTFARLMASLVDVLRMIGSPSLLAELAASTTLLICRGDF